MALKFKLNLGRIPVTLEVDDKEENYHLKEMVASSRDQYLDTVSERIRVDNSGRVTGIKKFDGMQADLLSRCMFYTDGPSADKPVTKSTIQAWPASVVAQLFKEAQELNRLNEKASDEQVEKKD